METRHLRYFLAVADAGSLTRAAETLGLAQPALSQALVRMEDLLGVKLFTRSRRGAQLTVAGQAILEDARLSLARIEAATEHARHIGQGAAGRLTIAFVATASLQLLPEALYAHREKMPRVEFILREMADLDQVAALEAGTIDVGLLYTPVEIRAHMRQRVIARYRMVAAVQEDFPVGSDGKVSLVDIARSGLVLFGTHEAPALRAAVLTAIRKLGEHPKIVQEASRTTTVLACVAAHLGSALVSSATTRVSFTGVRYVEVREVRMLPTMELSALWPVRSRPMLADKFVELLPSAG